MNKSTNIYRRCPYCPHHNQQTKCCCRKSTKMNKNRSTTKQKTNTLRNQSMVDVMDNSSIRFRQINIPTLVAQNSYLKTQNRQLKTDLYSITNFSKQSKNNSIQFINPPQITSFQPEPSQLLSEKLYISNKNLQQAILKIDHLSRQNKQLQQKILYLSSEIQSLNYQNEQSFQSCQSLKKKLKALQAKQKSFKPKQGLQQQMKVLRQKYEKLKLAHGDLLEEIETLKTRPLNRNQSLSPDSDWVASTSNKLSYISKNLDHLEHPEGDRRTDTPQLAGGNNFNYFHMIQNLKEQLAFATNRVHSQIRKFSSSFDTIGSVQNVNITHLICRLMEAFLENCSNLCLNVQTVVGKKISEVEKRFEKTVDQLQIMIMNFKVRQMRKRQSRSPILKKKQLFTNNRANSSSVLGSRKFVLQEDKENQNTLNLIHKNYY